MLALAAGGSAEGVAVFEANRVLLKVDRFLSCTVSRLIVSYLSTPVATVTGWPVSVTLLPPSLRSPNLPHLP